MRKIDFHPTHGKATDVISRLVPLSLYPSTCLSKRFWTKMSETNVKNFHGHLEKSHFTSPLPSSCTSSAMCSLGKYSPSTNGNFYISIVFAAVSFPSNLPVIRFWLLWTHQNSGLIRTNNLFWSFKWLTWICRIKQLFELVHPHFNQTICISGGYFSLITIKWVSWYPL